MKQICITLIFCLSFSSYAQHYKYSRPLWSREDSDYMHSFYVDGPPIRVGEKLSTCKLKVVMFYEKRISLDSIWEYNFSFRVINNDSTRCWFHNYFGTREDSTAFIKLELYRETNKGFTEEIYFRFGDSFTYIHGCCDTYYSMNGKPELYVGAHHYEGYVVPTPEFYDIRKKGRYKLKSKYKTIYDGLVIWRKMDDLIFEVY